MARLSIQQKLGKRIKHYRVQAGLTQEKLSLSTGLSQTYLSGIENGKRNPSIKTLAKISKTLGIPINELTDVDSYIITDQSRIIRH